MIRSRGFIASVLIVSFISLPPISLAQERRGANVIVGRKDGTQVRGELIAVKQDSLLLLSPVGRDESIPVADISSVTIKKKSGAGTGFLVGFLIGGVIGGVVGSKGVDPTVGRAGAIIGMGLILGGAVGLVGLGMGAAMGTTETIQVAGLSELEAQQVLTRLRGMARVRTAP